MQVEQIILLSVLFFIVSILYSLVGHGGGSGYIAIMGLVGILPTVIKPTALILNIIVSGIAFIYFYRAKHFSWSLFWPFVVGSIPLAYIGGSIMLPYTFYHWLVGGMLLFSAIRLFMPRGQENQSIHRPTLPIAVLWGMGIGLLSGLIGVGGGIFLSPIMLFLGWAKLKQISAVAAAFVFVNSVSGLLGHISSVKTVSPSIFLFGFLVFIGAFIGSRLGSSKLPDMKIKKVLAAVLFIGGLKMILA
ncbi:sulfite exporter TauE/SafE family protein [Salinibacillus xinjiangensis]|uniref:Probable membrane transporter protein n=1 Tax=Salinibacillus xinjiangensis TaxID=1229268 RepID=A0A6G1X400_9BACI|nr:sulfite exporter TauE/SafE family protein [Salinibacillus xinjiangensis]MRG85649.1 TSUP family transporter [Salinibacillus xinjiangensis]